MTARSRIVDELITKLKEVNGADPYNIDFYENVQKGLKYWDEVDDFPYICVIGGGETREYLPGNFKWAYLSVSIKIYVKGEDSEDLLEKALEDIEYVIDNNNDLQYDQDGETVTTEDIRILSIDTDEGLLTPLGVGDIVIQIRYSI